MPFSYKTKALCHNKNICTIDKTFQDKGQKQKDSTLTYVSQSSEEPPYLTNSSMWTTEPPIIVDTKYPTCISLPVLSEEKETTTLLTGLFRAHVSRSFISIF